MAIKLEKTFDNGVTANYWRVLSVQADADTKTLCGMVGVYIDKATRNEGKLPVSTILYNFTADSITGNLVSLVYGHLKQRQLSGGEDE